MPGAGAPGKGGMLKRLLAGGPLDSWARSDRAEEAGAGLLTAPVDNPNRSSAALVVAGVEVVVVVVEEAGEDKPHTSSTAVVVVVAVGVAEGAGGCWRLSSAVISSKSRVLICSMPCTPYTHTQYDISSHQSPES